MKILNTFGKDELARVYIADFGNGRIAEFVESLQPPYPREKKWVLIISTSFGCSVKCMMCDAGGNFKGRLSVSQIYKQIDYLVFTRYPDARIPATKFKIQFARMGEPSFSPDVLEVLRTLYTRYDAPGIMPCISTIAPSGNDDFFYRLISIKNKDYSCGRFQLQFSIHSTDEKIRDKLMPTPKWSLPKIAEYGKNYYNKNDRKITLNFALAKGIPLDPQVMENTFSPEHFLIKITPVNPTYSAISNHLQSHVCPTYTKKKYEIVDVLSQRGFDTLVSIGENEENLIGSNCGQFVMRHYRERIKASNSYLYAMHKNGLNKRHQ